mgnify:CR=1 FL=1
MTLLGSKLVLRHIITPPHCAVGLRHDFAEKQEKRLRYRYLTISDSVYSKNYSVHRFLLL